MRPPRTIGAHQADALGVKPATVRKWAQRGRLHAVGLDRFGRPLYAVEHVAQLAARRVDRRERICHA